MKNEIGRKLTSLTIMAIMFAGGMTVAAPSFMPGALAQTAKPPECYPSLQQPYKVQQF